MKVAIKSQNAGWVLDSIVKDYKKYSRHDIVNLDQDPDVFWSVSLFSYPSIASQIPKGCKKVLQMHHIDESKLGEYNFKVFNTADACLVPNKITEAVAKKYMKIPIVRIPYWLLSFAMSERNDVEIERVKGEISDGEILIGSFVKDGNGTVGKTPKLSKGPDILIDVLDKLSQKMKIKVVLAGYSRQYLIFHLKEKKIPYIYLQKYKDINTLYDCLDWYLSTSRYEGGPQSVFEASYRNVKILSTRVGIAPEILHPNCICASSEDFVDKVMLGIDEKVYNKDVVKKFTPDKIVPLYDDFFERMNDG